MSLFAQQRITNSIAITTIFGKRSVGPISAVLAESETFALALAEARQNHQDENTKPAIGAKWLAFFHSFVTALTEADIGGINKAVLKEWLDKVDALPKETAPMEINLVCKSFSIHELDGEDQEKVRLQIGLEAGQVKDAVIRGLSNVVGVTVATGPAREGFYEEELGAWMEVLHIKD